MAANGCAPRRVLAGWLGLAMAGCAEPQHFVRTGGPAAEPLVGTTAAAEVAPRPVGCAEALGALGRTAGGAAAGDGSGPAGLALLEEPGRPAAALRIDLAVPVVRRPAEVSTGCLLLVEIEAQPAERRVLGRERVWSEREVSIERRPNPEYELARRELARLADRLDREDREQARDLKRLAPTGNALVDALGLVGGLVLGGIGSFARDREFEEARARLESIPRWIEESRSEPYQVTVAETELVRRATVRLALVEPDGRRYWATVAPLVRTDRLRVAVDPLPRDRGRLAGEWRLATPADLEALAAAPPPVTLSELLPRLVALVGEPGRPGGAAEARFAWANPSAARLAGAPPAAAPTDVGTAPTPARSPAAAGRPAPLLPGEQPAGAPAGVDPSEIALGPVAVATGRPDGAAEAHFAWANAPAPKLAGASPAAAPTDVGAAATPARSAAAAGRPTPPLPAEKPAGAPAGVDPSEIAPGPVAVATGRTGGAAEARFAWANPSAPRLAGVPKPAAEEAGHSPSSPARSPATTGRPAPPLPAEQPAGAPASVDPSEIALGPVAVATGRPGGAAEARFAWANSPAPRLAGVPKPAAEEAGHSPSSPARAPAAAGRPAPPLPGEQPVGAPRSVEPSAIALGPVAVATGRPGGAAEARFAWANAPAPQLAGASPAFAPADVGAAATPARSPAAAGRPVPPRPGEQPLGAPASVDPLEIALGPVAVATGRPGGAAEARFAWANAPAPPLPAEKPAGAPASVDPAEIALGPVAVEGGRRGRREASGASAGAAEATAALVRVQGPGGEAHGFYLARDKIVTLGRVLGGSSLARIETADGFTTWGVVERERPGSELLLLHVPRPGRPLPTAGSAAAGLPAGPLPEPGMPVLVEGRVVAVSLDPLAGRLAGPAELARLLAELKGR